MYGLWIVGGGSRGKGALVGEWIGWICLASKKYDVGYQGSGKQMKI